MKLSDISKNELETMNYDDIAYVILNEEKTKMKINILFKKVCDALELSEKEFEDNIAAFFQPLMKWKVSLWIIQCVTISSRKIICAEVPLRGKRK